MVMRKNRGSSPSGLFKKRNGFVNAKDYNDWFKKMVIRTVVSAILLVAAATVQVLDFKQPKKILNFVETKLESNFNIVTCLAEVKKIPGYISTLGDKAISVMKIEYKSDSRFVLPTDGEIAAYFDDKIDGTSDISKGLLFINDEGEDIYSVGDGVIIDVGSNKLIGNYIIIKHKGELLSVYKYVGTNNIISINQRVKQGQVIGTSSGKLLLETWYRNEPIDPIKYMNINI